MTTLASAAVFAALSLFVAGNACAQSCTEANDACFFAQPLGQGDAHLRYYASRSPDALDAPQAPSELLIAIHGHSHDANKTFNATLKAVNQAGRAATTLVVAPLFQTEGRDSAHCSTPGVPGADGHEPTWSCSSWIDGAPAAQGGAAITSYQALDTLVAALLARTPSIRRVTFAGFSAGAQTVQHYLALAAPLPSGVSARFVVSDPGTWLYFDPVRSTPSAVAAGGAPCTGAPAPLGSCQLNFAPPEDAACAGYDRWKYGTTDLPARFATTAAAMRERYRHADVRYLEGSEDQGRGPGTAARVLDQSCSAMLQGPDRLHRGVAYAQYDASVLQSPTPHPLAIVPGCAHDVACVFPTKQAEQALFADQP